MDVNEPDKQATVSLMDEKTIRLANLMADAAGAVIMPYFRQPLVVDNKTPEDGFDPVTIADREAELAIREVIEANFPNDGILGEEFGVKDSASGLTWILDPIDGTRAFITGVPQWGTLIGLHDGERSIFGLVDQPFLNERYIGTSKSADLFVNGKHQRSLATRSCQDSKNAVMMCTTPEMFSPDELTAFNQLSSQAALTRFGGDCYAYCMLASGYVDLVVESGLQAYDIQPLIPIIESAGGIVSNWQGMPVTAGGAVVAAGDKHCHETALKILSNS